MSTMSTIYYVEDDRNIRELTCYALTQAGFKATGFPRAAGFIAACDEQLPDAILLDIMLPDTSGLELLRGLRSHEATRAVPIMMLTAKGTELDIVTGLEQGADDYLAKPFGMMELISRVNALLRMASRGGAATAAPNTALTNGPVTLEPARHRVTVAGAEVGLTAKEFALLHVFMEHPGLVFTRGQLLQQVWGLDYAQSTRTVDVHIRTLRQKLGDAGVLVQTVRGIGYRASDKGLV